ncbi:Tex family protein [Bacteroidota bacterium]
MKQDHISKIASEEKIEYAQVKNAIQLLDDGGTIPFISRYRKEATGGLDEVIIRKIRDRMTQLRDLDKRKEAVLKSIKEQEKLTPELEHKILNAETLSILEDLYLPYRPKRRTKATVAREKGLEPLAKLIFDQRISDVNLEAEKYLDDEKEVKNIEEALQGARDIIAEWISEDAEARKDLRSFFFGEGIIKSKVIKGKEEEGQKYKDYYDWEEPLKKIPSHRLLAMRRGEKEMILSLDISPDESEALNRMRKRFVKSGNICGEQVSLAVKDSYKRLLKPSLETEIRQGTKQDADMVAIRVFAENLKQLLLSAPLGEKSVLAIDPGFRTGCKVVCLNRQGKLLHHTAIFPNEPQKKVVESAGVINNLISEYKIEAIAIGNGTASRETERFIKSIGIPGNVQVIVVNESGASIYSASDVAREEFPDYDVTVRGAISIGRRLMDPLAELVKIDPKSIGVGQYQHDVDQNALKISLDDVVMSSVNAVGVEVNTASKELLSYVSGLGPQLAGNIVNHRNENGPFKDRNALKKVPRMGEKAFEQSAGFLRIRDAKNPLDKSAVHPERYKLVDRMASDMKCSVLELMNHEDLARQLNVEIYITEDIGMLTLNDILEELAKPGRDPREQFESISFLEGIDEIEDLKVGMSLPGIVTNITNFGAFVDVGVHQDGLVHISHLSDQYVSDPNKVVTLNQQVNVTVMEVDISRRRISLSMKSDPFTKQPQKVVQKSKKQENNASDGDLQAKLSMLKGKFK